MRNEMLDFGCFKVALHYAAEEGPHRNFVWLLFIFFPVSDF